MCVRACVRVCGIFLIFVLKIFFFGCVYLKDAIFLIPYHSVDACIMEIEKNRFCKKFFLFFSDQYT